MHTPGLHGLDGYKWVKAELTTFNMHSMAMPCGADNESIQS